MALPQIITIGASGWAGLLPVQTSAGSGSAGAIPALNSEGLIDSSMLSASSGGEVTETDLTDGSISPTFNSLTVNEAITQTPGQGANNSTPLAQYGDLFSDAIVSGLTTTTSSTLTGTLAAGVAYVMGQRVPYGGGTYTVAASSTSYLDLSDTGGLTVSTSSTVTANSLRLWSVTSDASAITGVAQVASEQLIPNIPLGLTLAEIQQGLGVVINGFSYAALSIQAPNWGGSFTGNGNDEYGDEQNILEVTAPYAVSDYTFGATDPRLFCYALTNTGDLIIRFPQGNAAINDYGNNAGVVTRNFKATNSATLTGTTAGTIVSSMPEQGVYKKFAAYANGYENDTATAQTITFPTAFANPPVVTTNTTGLSLTVSTTGLTINAPNNTTTYTGLIIVEGI